jgi:hypothetical protein
MANAPVPENFVCAYCLKDGSSSPAVTAVEGTLLCEEHARIAISMHRMRHD